MFERTLRENSKIKYEPLVKQHKIIFHRCNCKTAHNYRTPYFLCIGLELKREILEETGPDINGVIFRLHYKVNVF